MRRLLTPRWMAGHLLVWAAVAVCLGLGWWQAGRAADGNTLSWAYTFEWPLFAAFILLLWIREMRLTLRGHPLSGSSSDGREDRGRRLKGDEGAPSAGANSRSARPGPGVYRREPVITRRTAAYDDDGDAQLAAYNEYLAWLREHPEARPSDYPGQKERV